MYITGCNLILYEDDDDREDYDSIDTVLNCVHQSQFDIYQKCMGNMGWIIGMTLL